MIKEEYYVLSNGVKIPKMALGTWQVANGEQAYNACSYAIKAGYKHIDTANGYGNEESVGQAIIDSKIAREDIFITTKLPAEIKTYEGAKESFAKSLKNLKVDYIDLYLIHAPWPWSAIGMDCTKGNIEAWKAMIELYNEGKIRAIGVSNFSPRDIQAIVDATGFVPHVNQIRFFVGNIQKETVEYCKKNNILVEAYSPLATGRLLSSTKLTEIADKYNTTPAKLCIRFCVQMGTIPLPKSVHEERIIDNTKVDFVISDEDMEILKSFDDGVK